MGRRSEWRCDKSLFFEVSSADAIAPLDRTSESLTENAAKAIDTFTRVGHCEKRQPSSSRVVATKQSSLFDKEERLDCFAWYRIGKPIRYCARNDDSACRTGSLFRSACQGDFDIVQNNTILCRIAVLSNVLCPIASWTLLCGRCCHLPVRLADRLRRHIVVIPAALKHAGHAARHPSPAQGSNHEDQSVFVF